MADGEYYILKCPYCDDNITKVMETITDNIVTCPHCDKELNLYSVFGYNMWLAENNKTKKVKRKPIKDVKSNRNRAKEYYDEDNMVVEFNFDADDYEFNEEAIAEDYINHSHLMQRRPKALEEILSFNADICTMQYRYLLKMGFTRPEAIELIKKLIEQSFLL